jgi:hypothetical protein
VQIFSTLANSDDTAFYVQDSTAASEGAHMGITLFENSLYKYVYNSEVLKSEAQRAIREYLSALNNYRNTYIILFWFSLYKAGQWIEIALMLIRI